MKFINLEYHPMDSRIRVVDEDICQTLSNRMGTGGGNVPIFIVGGGDESSIRPSKIRAVQKIRKIIESEASGLQRYYRFSLSGGGAYGDYRQPSAKDFNRCLMDGQI